MVVQQPFMYDPLEKQANNTTLPYKPFDPKAVTRASLEPKPRKKKQSGPLLNFNAHPDSYMVVPRGSGVHVPPSMKQNIVRSRKALLVFRVFALFTSMGALCTMVMVTANTSATLWLMRIAPGVAILHTFYGSYHLFRKASGRPPGSTASYMLFASMVDVALLGVYGFCIYTAYKKWEPSCGFWQGDASCQSDWKLYRWFKESGNPFSEKILLFSNFLLFAISALWFLITFGLSLSLFHLFRQIVQLPPDCNPLEDNLTSRMGSVRKEHKRNKSSISTMTYDDSASARFSMRSTLRPGSGAVYEDFAAPPSIPFMHTRNNSSSSLNSPSFTAIPTTSSPRDSRLDLPSRNYAIPYNNSASNSPRNSTANLRRGSNSPVKGSNGYARLSDADGHKDTWFANSNPNRNTMPNFSTPNVSPPRSPLKQMRPQTNGYTQLQPAYDFDAHRDNANRGSVDLGASRYAGESRNMTQGVPTLASPKRVPIPQRESALSAMTLGRQNTVQTISSSVYSQDDGTDSDLGRVSTIAAQEGRYEVYNKYEFEDEDENRSLTSSPSKEKEKKREMGKLVEERRRMYGDLGAGDGKLGAVPAGRAREVSGNDFARRDVSGKVAEEGRGGEQWGARHRKVSGFGR